MSDLAVFNMPTRPRDLEPAQIPNGLVGALDRHPDGVVNALFRCTDQFDHPIDMTVHVGLRILVRMCSPMAKSIGHRGPTSCQAKAADEGTYTLRMRRFENGSNKSDKLRCASGAVTSDVLILVNASANITRQPGGRNGQCD